MSLKIKNAQQTEFTLSHPDGAAAKTIDSTDIQQKSTLNSDVIASNLNKFIDVDFVTDADLDLSADPSQGYGIINLTDTGVVLTTAKNVIFNNIERNITVFNNTAQTLTIKTSAGTGIDVPSSGFDLLRCDGTNIVKQINAEGGNTVSGTATFTNVDNNISLPGIGNLYNLEVGDVIQVSGSTSNNTEYTVEVITDADNVIVNQAHAGGTTSKSLTDETSTAGVTVRLLSKWYHAPTGLGQGKVDVTSVRSTGVTYTNNTGREKKITIFMSWAPNTNVSLTVDGIDINGRPGSTTGATTTAFVYFSENIPKGASYTLVVNTGAITDLTWVEEC